MAEDKGFITFKGINEGLTDAFYLTQAAANAAAVDNADIVAHVGELELEGFSPNVAYFDGDKLLAEIPETKLPTLDRKKLKARQLHDYLHNKSAEVEEEAVVHDFHEHQIIHNIIAFAHHGNYLTCHDSELTDDQIIEWLDASLLGPTDAKTATEWFTAVQALSDPVAPSGAQSWVQEADGVRVTVAGIAQVSSTNYLLNTLYLILHLASGAWIEEIDVMAIPTLNTALAEGVTVPAGTWRHSI